MQDHDTAPGRRWRFPGQLVSLCTVEARANRSVNAIVSFVVADLETAMAELAEKGHKPTDRNHRHRAEPDSPNTLIRMATWCTFLSTLAERTLRQQRAGHLRAE